MESEPLLKLVRFARTVRHRPLLNEKPTNTLEKVESAGKSGITRQDSTAEPLRPGPIEFFPELLLHDLFNDLLEEAGNALIEKDVSREISIDETIKDFQELLEIDKNLADRTVE